MIKGLLFIILAGATLLLRFTSGYDDYYTISGFHVQKQGLASVLLFLAMLVVSVSSYTSVQTKAGKIGVLVSCGVLSFFALFLIPQDMIGFDRRVNNGTLVEKTGDMSPLMMAAWQGDLREMDRLVKNGADINARNDVNNTALHFAAGGSPVSQIYRGSSAAVSYLIEHGADVNAQNNAGFTPLMDAALNPNLESVKILLAHGADANSRSKYDLDTNALTTAVRRIEEPPPGPWQAVYRDIAIELIRHGADPNIKDLRGPTPLDRAESMRDDGLIKELKEHGAKE